MTTIESKEVGAAEIEFIELEKYNELNEEHQKALQEKGQAQLQSQILLEAAKKQAERLSNALFDLDLALVQLNMLQEKQSNQEQA